MINFRKLRPLLNRVLIQKPEALQKTKGGILLPENRQE
jgi:co-chaperonin GroES (HSP10)